MPWGLASADPSGIFGIPVEIRESHCRPNRAAVEQYRPAQFGRLGRGLEAAFGNDAFGVIGTKSRMDTKYLVHCVNELLLDRLILSPDDRNPC